VDCWVYHARSGMTDDPDDVALKVRLEVIWKD